MELHIPTDYEKFSEQLGTLRDALWPDCLFMFNLIDSYKEITTRDFYVTEQEIDKLRADLECMTGKDFTNNRADPVNLSAELREIEKCKDKFAYDYHKVLEWCMHKAYYFNLTDDDKEDLAQFSRFQ